MFFDQNNCPRVSSMISPSVISHTDEAKEGVRAFEEKRMPSFARFRR